MYDKKLTDFLYPDTKCHGELHIHLGSSYVSDTFKDIFILYLTDGSDSWIISVMDDEVIATDQAVFKAHEIEAAIMEVKAVLGSNVALGKHLFDWLPTIDINCSGAVTEDSLKLFVETAVAYKDALLHENKENVTPIRNK